MPTATYHKPTVASLRHRVALCSMRDVVAKDGSIELTRKEITKTWAAIDVYRHHGSFMSQAGIVILEAAHRQTHVVMVRAQLGLDFTSAAWVYEERRKSPPRWYKVLSFADPGNWVELAVHLVEKSDTAVAPKGDLDAIQSKVRL